MTTRLGDAAALRSAAGDGTRHNRHRRWLDIRLRLIDPPAFRAMAEAAGFRVAALYGDYGRVPFQEDTSPFMIRVLER